MSVIVMDLLFELSGEHQHLPMMEVRAVLETISPGAAKLLLQEPGLCVFSVEGISVKHLEMTLAMTRNILLREVTSKAGSFMEEAGKFLPKAPSFRIRATRVGEHHRECDLRHIVKELGRQYSKASRVDLEHPEQDLRVLLSESIHLCSVLAKIDSSSFQARKPNNRPYFSPVSLHPKLARVMVNLSRTRAGGKLMDPFCGTGGILIEAGLIGLDAVGGDIDLKMVEGTRANLAHSGARSIQVHLCDFQELASHDGRIDSIVTDPPFGRSATTAGEPLNKLMSRAYATMRRALAPGGHLVLTVPSEELVELGKKHFELVESVSIRVHKSLTRWLCVFR